MICVKPLQNKRTKTNYFAVPPRGRRPLKVVGGPGELRQNYPEHPVQCLQIHPEGGSVDIRLRTGKDSTLPKPLQQYAEITVTDSGIGIAPKKQNTYSNAFTRYGIAKTTQT